MSDKRNQRRLLLVAVALIALLSAASYAQAGGIWPGDVNVDINCYNRKNNSFCGAYSVPATIGEDKKMYRLPSREQRLSKCRELYPACCPTNFCRVEHKYCQTWNCWEDIHP